MIYYEATLLLLLLLLFLLFLFVMYLRAEKKWINSVQWKVLIENPGIASAVSFPVIHSATKPGVFSLFTKRETGIINISKHGISFTGYKYKYVPVKLEIPVQNLHMAWVGKLEIHGRRHWFMVINGKENHYFSAETGRLCSSNEKYCREVFAEIKSNLEKHTSSRKTATGN